MEVWAAYVKPLPVWAIRDLAAARRVGAGITPGGPKRLAPVGAVAGMVSKAAASEWISELEWRSTLRTLSGLNPDCSARKDGGRRVPNRLAPVANRVASEDVRPNMCV